MPLNIGTTGSATQYAKYNSKADKWFARGETGDVEIAPPTFIADMRNITTGWLRFVEGQAPERVMDPSLDRVAPCPGQWVQAGLRHCSLQPELLRRGGRTVERLDSRRRCHPRALRGVRGVA